MDNRKFQAAASASPPDPEASPSTGYPTDGNPATATPATIPGAAWFHQIGEELRAVIEAAGLTPSNGVLDQLLTALRSAGVFQTQLATDNSTKVATTAWAKQGFSVSLGANGYIVFPSWLGGLIIQWGSFTTSAAGYTNWTFPIAFPNAVYKVIGSSNQSTPSTVAVSNNGANNTLTTASMAASSGNSYTATNLSLIAIGY
ncbi:hypothetical protein V2P20_03780 [Methylobacter sp. Wu1]|uniref:gp53-like domain-containing protein n=1 Tax=Methylobacter sp. Wu1 TaxID=3119359 RepID=UPI002F91C773